MMIRYFKHCKYKVKYIRNITDIDDKIIQKSTFNNESISSLTDRMIQSMNYNFSKLGLLKPNIEPQVTHHISDIINNHKKTNTKKHAYVAKNGDVVFSVLSCKSYGTLSRQKIFQLQNKKYNTKNKAFKHDFVLWKKVDDLNYPNWNSPWGLGRPGWHIECSAMNDKYFGHTLDIHGGGVDLLFPHHENERAQSTCLYNTGNYGKYWVHVGALLINNNKMSKSLNNVIFLHHLLESYNAEVIRYFFLSTHYRKPISYNINNVIKANMSLRKLYIALSKMDKNHIVLKTKFSLEYQFFAQIFMML